MIYNKILEHVILPAGDRLLHTHFMEELRWWRKTAKLSAAELKSMQQRSISTLLTHATTHSPYYRNLNIRLSGDAYSDIKKFPLLTKHVLRDSGDALLTPGAKDLIEEKSSGSSGLQTQVYMSKRENAQNQAALIFLWETAGYKLGDKIMQTGITPYRGVVKSVKDFLLRTTYINAYDLSEEKLIAYLQKAKKGRHKFFAGFAASLNTLAKVALANKIDVQFESVISWGDKLFDHYKTNIQQAFDTPSITELYGSTEGFVISGSCKKGNHHVMSPHVYLELLDKNGNETKEGDWGYVVVTRLDAFAFPLIRYYLGDLAVKAGDASCACGSSFPYIKKIIGRDTDVVQTPSGKELIVHFFTGTFEHFQQVQQYRVVQREKSKIEIEYIPAANFSEDVLKQIEKIMYTKANEVFPVEWKRVAEVPLTKSGKPQIIQNFVATNLQIFIKHS